MATFTHVMPGEHVYDGVLYAGTIVPEVLDRIKSCDFHDDDIILATYAKSGTLWMVEMMSLVMRNGEAEELHQQPLPSRMPSIEIRRANRGGKGDRGRGRGKGSLGRGAPHSTTPDGNRGRRSGHTGGIITRPIYHSTVDDLAPTQLIDALDRFLSAPAPRMGRTHLPWQFFQRTLEQKQTKFVVVLRNVFDVAVSYYHFYTEMASLGSFQGDFSEFFDMFIDGHVMYGSWFDWTQNWWQHCKDNPNVCFFFYEDMKQDLEGNICKLAAFLGKELSPETIGSIKELCTFEAMRPGNEKFARKGMVGEWKNYFTTEQIQTLQNRYQMHVKTTGLKFDLELLTE